MGKNEAESNVNIVFLLKCLLFSYVLTAGLLLLLAFMLYRFGLQEKIVNIIIILIYIAVTFCAGFLAGKKMKSRRFMWGLIMGVSYFVILLLVSLVANRSAEEVTEGVLTVFLLCAGSGMLGGMLS